MSLFKKSKQAAESAGRRRPLQDSDSQQLRGAGTIFSYHSQRSPAQNSAGRRESIETIQDTVPRPFITFIRRRALILLIALGVIVLLLFASSLTPDPHVVLLQDETTAYFLQSEDVYAQTVHESLQKSVFNRNKLTVDTASVRADLLKQYPEIKNVSVALPLLGHQPQVYIEPYKPSFILTTTSGGAFLLDETGRALANTSQISDIDHLNLPTLQDKTGLDVKLGNRAIPSTTVIFVQTVIKALQAKDVPIKSLSLPAGSYELDVAIAGQPYYVKFNLENDALQQAGTYLAVRGRLQSDKTTPKEYVDVRVPDRAYYK